MFRRKGISNGVQTEWNLRERDFWNERDPGDLELKSGKLRGGHKAGRRACPWVRPHPCGPLVAPLTDFFRLYISIYPKNIGEQNRPGVPPPQAFVATKNQSGPCSGTLLEGESLTSGHLHHPGALHDEEGVVHPRGWGWGYVPVAMAQSWCIPSFAVVVGSYDVSPPLLSCNGLSFPFEVILSDWVFKDLRTLDVCLAVDICGDNGIFTWSTWCMFWWSTCGFRDLGNLCIGVGTRFHLYSPVETLGHSLRFYELVE